MIPIGDDNPTFRTPYVTYAILAGMAGAWVFGQGAGFDVVRLASTACDYGLVPGELTGQAPLGQEVPLGPGLSCVVDDQAINILTPITSMFLHGGWAHLLGNALFFWVFGNNVEDSMGHVRFVLFYLICGLAAAATHVLLDPASPVPTVGASGAISGIMGAYLVLYPRVHVRMLFIFVIFFRVFELPAWLVLIMWFGYQVLTGLPELSRVGAEISGGVAVWAHIGGFLAGVVLIKLFEDRRIVALRDAERHRLHPGHP
jgi:membrane associated rhomboid family serine protease